MAIMMKDEQYTFRTTEDIVWPRSSMDVVLMHPDAKLPCKKNPEDAGWDVYSPIDASIEPNNGVKINLGIKVGLPYGCHALICDRSSMGAKFVTIGGGVFDNAYTGELSVCLINGSDKCVHIKKGDRIAQLVLIQHLRVPDGVKQVDSLPDTSRGEKGFGSSGR